MRSVVLWLGITVVASTMSTLGLLYLNVEASKPSTNVKIPSCTPVITLSGVIPLCTDS